MNNTNPFIPQGSLLEQKNRKRARVKMAVIAIFAFTIVLISPALLIQGCKRSDQSAQTDGGQSDATTAAAVDTNVTATPAMAATPSLDTNVTNPVAAPMANAPAAQPTAVSAPAAATTYIVVPHDTLAGIAKKFNVKLSALEAANPGVVPTKLSVGKPLNIPAGAAAATTAATTEADSDIYVVKSGDNLTKIASTHGTSVKALMDLNSLKTTRINVGDKLKLPVKATASASPMETMPTTTATASNPTSGTPVIR